MIHTKQMRLSSLLVFIIMKEIFCGLVNRKTLLCYYPNWAASRQDEALFIPEQINPFLCTHIVYVYAKLDENNLIIASQNPFLDLEENQGLDLYRRTCSLKNKNPSLRIILGVGGFFESNSVFLPSNVNQPNKYSQMVSTRERRKKFINHAIYFLKHFNFDGLEVHWEFPGREDKKNFAAFVQECKQEFRPYRLSLSLALSTVPSVIDEAYDIPIINRYVNHVVLMTYDFHGFYEGSVKLMSPLFRFEGSPYNVNDTVKMYRQRGMSPSKIILGIATYAKSYTLLDRKKTLPGSPSSGPGEEGPYTRTEGYQAYYEICDDDWIKVDDPSGTSGPYAFRDDQWVSYSDPDSVRAKSEYVINEGLRGVAFWSIEQDDFSGNFCSEGPNPLISTSHRVLFSRFRTGASQSRRRYTSNLPSIITDRCTLPGVFDDPADCRRYYFCRNGILSSRSCGDSLYWNQNCFCCVLSNLHCFTQDAASISSNSSAIY